MLPSREQVRDWTRLPTTQRAYDGIAGRYDVAYGRRRDRAENQVLARELDRLAVWYAPRVLDLGCGTGFLLDLAKHQGHPISADRYVGVDVTDGMLHQAREKYPYHRFVTDNMLAHLDRQPAESADAIVCLWSAPYLAGEGDQQWLAEEIFRVLRRGGVLVLALYAPAYMRSQEPTPVNDRAWDVDVVCHTPDWAGRLYPGFRLRGFSWKVGRLPSGLYAQLELATVGRWWPALGDFLLISGRW